MDRPRIMLVEDELIISMDVRQILEDLNYAIAASPTSAEAALELIKETKPDLVLMDIVLAGEMDGISAAKIIRERYDIPVLFLTGNADIPTVRRARDSEPYGFVLKPVTATDLFSAIDTALNRRSLERRLIEKSEELEATNEELQAAIEEQEATNEGLRLSYEELRHTQEILRGSEEKFLKAFTLNPTGMAITTIEDGRFIEVNQSFLESTGLSREEVIGKTSAELGFFNPPDQRLKIIDALKSSGSAKNIEVTVTIKSGKLVHGLFSADILRLGEGDFILSALMDITERKRIEAELRSSEEKFLKAFTLNPMSMAISTIEEGRFIDVNKTFLESLRYTREEVIGRTSAELGIFSPPEQRLKIINALRTAGSARNIEVVIAAKDGTLSYGLFSAEILKLGEGDFILSALMDITERKRVEAELRSSEEKYRLLHESMKDGFVSLDLDGYILECNESYCSMVGYTAEELSHMTYLDLTPEEWRGVQAHIIEEQVLTRGYSDVYEKEYRRKDGTVFPVELRSFLTVKADGTRSGMWAIVRDITERKRAEKGLQLSELKFSTAFHANPDMSVITDPATGLFIDVNEAFLEWSGFTREEIIGHTSLEVKLWADEEDRNVHVPRLVTRERIDHEEARLRIKNGEIRLLEYSARIIEIGGEKCLLFVFRDITERRQMEEALRRSEAQYRKLVATVPGVVYDFRMMPDGTYLFPFLSKGIYELAGVPEDDGSLDTSAILDLIQPGAREAFNASIMESFTNLTPWLYEFPITTTRGEEKWIRGHSIPEREPDGSVIWHGVLVDITANKKTEERLRDSLHEKDALLREIHHRVKNNLQVITSLLNLQANKFVDEELSRQFDIARNRIKSMSLIHEKFYQSEDLSRICFGDYIRSIARDLERSYPVPGKPARLVFDLDRVFMSIDQAIPCGLIVNEIITNSFKHAFPPGWHGTPEIHITLRLHGAIAEITVRDNGKGISGEAGDGAMGFLLIDTLAAQIKATVTRQADGGTAFTISFACE